MMKLSKATLNILCAAVGFTALLTSPAIAATDAVAQIGFDTMPDDCKSAYPDIPGFLAFYDNTISMMVAKRGPGAKGVTDLFAVSELRSELDGKIPNPGTESALDRLIVSQLCTFREIFLNENPQAQVGRRIVIEASNDALHDHLARIAPKLYKDSRDFAQYVLADLARRQRKNELVERKRDEIRRARAAGRARIDDLVN